MAHETTQVELQAAYRIACQDTLEAWQRQLKTPSDVHMREFQECVADEAKALQRLENPKWIPKPIGVSGGLDPREVSRLGVKGRESRKNARKNITGEATPDASEQTAITQATRAGHPNFSDLLELQ